MTPADISEGLRLAVLNLPYGLKAGGAGREQD